MAGKLPRGKRVVVWDDDHYYMGGVLAELLAERGYERIDSLEDTLLGCSRRLGRFADHGGSGVTVRWRSNPGIKVRIERDFENL